MSCGIVVCIPGQDVQSFKIDDLGHGTNNVAEWSGLLWAVIWARDNGHDQIRLIGDSQLVVKQARGEWRAKDPLLNDMREEFRGIAKNMELDITHVLRDMNLAGVYLEHGQL
jgi:ribonuclease HI